MIEPLPPGLDEAFLSAATELGMCTAAWLFVREAEASGPGQLEQLRDALGRTFPVLDAVIAARLGGAAALAPNASALDALDSYRRIVVVGLEANELDALVARRGTKKLALLTEAAVATDWARILSNFSGHLEAVDLAGFQRWAGPHSALLTFAYGVSGATTRVPPLWLRVAGDDVRTQFGALVAWDVLRHPMFVYPRWQVEVATDSFTRLLP